MSAVPLEHAATGGEDAVCIEQASYTWYNVEDYSYESTATDTLPESTGLVESFH
jgi:hypothetical protein